MARRKFCGVVSPHASHIWSQDDVPTNPEFLCAGVRRPSPGQVVYVSAGEKYRIHMVLSTGRVILRRRGKVDAHSSLHVGQLEWDRVTGMWRVRKERA